MKTRYTLALIAFLITSILTFSHASEKPVKPFIVVLDAGHGGKDPGNLGNGYMEKIIALKIALKAGALLSINQDIRVIYTRDGDQFVDLFKRGEIANKASADLFISIHCDSHTSNANGAGTFVLGLHANKRNFEVAKKENSAIYLEENFEQRYAQYDINSPESVIGFTIMQEEFLDQSISLAKSMQSKFANELNRTDRKIKQAGFIVLHQTFMPSVLVETGFLTNANEGAYLNSKEGQDQMAKAISDAVLEYKKNIHTSSVASNPQEKLLVNNAPKNNETPLVKTPIKTVFLEEDVLEEEVAEKKTPTGVTTELTTEVIEKITKQTPVSGAKETPLETSKEVKTPIKGALSSSTLIFKIQLMAVGKIIPLRSENFKGLKNITKEPIRSLNRYLYGATSDYDTAKELLIEAVKVGYSNAFVTAYKDGEKITLTEALKSLENQ